MTDNKKNAARDWTLPVSFYFKVKIGNEEFAFKEVSGLNVEMEIETLKEGGVNNYEYKLPKQIKHTNLVLKRAILPVKNNLIVWIRGIMEGDFSSPLKPRDIVVSLLDHEGNPLNTWTCEKAYPVKWDIESMDSEKNNIMIESIEFVYQSLKRQ